MENLAAHHDPVVPVLLSLMIVLVTAKFGALIASWLKQPSVLGELVAGIVMGNLALLNFDAFTHLAHDHYLEVFSGLGVIILLFEVGLESKINEMLEVGVKSFLVAIVGVITPFMLGYFVSGLIVTDLTEIQKIFMGAILTATSVGITARVFQDLNYLKKEEARIVLGAAVIDDILGLIILAIVSGIAVSGTVELGTIAKISIKSIGFVIGALIIGMFLAKRTFKVISMMKIPGIMFTSALVVCFLGAYLADQVGLATIVGAFAMGLILEDVHFQNFNTDMTIEQYIRPVSYMFVPVFFIMTGMAVDLSVFADFSILGAALAISVVALVGKLVCGWAFPSDTPINRLVIGVGMVPRGEVGLIFATVGKSVGVVDDKLFAITVIMVILSTLVAPPILNILIKD